MAVAVFHHVAIAVLLAALIYTNRNELKSLFFSREDAALLGIDSKIGSAQPKYSRVAVGVNANVDLIVSALSVFDKLGIKPTASSQNRDVINSLQELEECFSFYFKKCGAAERFVANGDVFNQIVQAAEKVQGAQYDVGGNAALMGLKMLYTNKNTTVLLGGPVGPKLSEMLDKRIIIPDSLRQTSDEYHLILEYAKGEVWGEHTSSCANRFIVTHDNANGQMAALDGFFDSLLSFNPQAIVISGLHLLEGQPEELKQDKIASLQSKLETLPSDTPVHLELASMTSSEFMKGIVEQIFPFVDSIGLNEQELAFISRSLGGPGTPSELGQWPPEIGLTGDILYWMLNSFGKDRNSKEASRLTRIHFHCLTYHITAVFPEIWNNSMIATAAGSRAASRQACDKEVLDDKDVELRTPEIFARSVNNMELRRNLVKRDEANPVTEWSYNGIDFHFSAVLVCRQPKRTVGLGDCISASGLQYSDFLLAS